MRYIFLVWVLGIGLFKLIDTMAKQDFYLKQYLFWSILVGGLLITASTL
jgi:hypothetical protein